MLLGLVEKGLEDCDNQFNQKYVTISLTMHMRIPLLSLPALTIVLNFLTTYHKFFFRIVQGYTGNKCEIPCRCPSYGEYCKQECNCEEQYCNHITGCQGISPRWSIAI